MKKAFPFLIPFLLALVLHYPFPHAIPWKPSRRPSICESSLEKVDSHDDLLVAHAPVDDASAPPHSTSTAPVSPTGTILSPDPIEVLLLIQGFSTTTTRIQKEVLQEQQGDKNIVINEDEPEKALLRRFLREVPNACVIQEELKAREAGKRNRRRN